MFNLESLEFNTEIEIVKAMTSQSRNNTFNKLCWHNRVPIVLKKKLRSKSLYLI